MKKLTIALALILTLVLCVFSFASCGKKKGADAATEAATEAKTEAATEAKTDAATDAKTEAATDAKTDAATEAETEPATEAETEPATDAATEAETEPETEDPDVHVHVPDDDPIILDYPTCVTPGLQIYVCRECGEEIEGTEEEIDPDPDAHLVNEWEVTEVGNLFVVGSRRGVCEYCDQEFVEDYNPTIIEKKYTTSAIPTSQRFETQNIYNDILQGGELHFYPTDDNTSGNDLLIEYSFLWNDTFANLGTNNNSGGHPIICTRITNSSDNDSNDLVWMSLKDNASGSDCTFAGGYEYGSCRTVEVGPAGMSTASDGKCHGTQYGDFPNIGGDDPENPEWGWHRVSIRFHQELTNEDALKADETAGATEATYLFFVETYVDGVLLSRLSNAASSDFGSSTAFTSNRLFTAASDGEGGIIYTDIGDARYLIGMRLPFTKTLQGTAYAVLADYYGTAGQEFVQNVVRVDEPEANVYVTKDGTEIAAPIYFALAE